MQKTIVITGASDGIGAAALLRKADDCLYEAKQKRRETSIRY